MATFLALHRLGGFCFTEIRLHFTFWNGRPIRSVLELDYRTFLRMHPFPKDVSSYFDVPMRKDSFLEPSITPISPSAVPTRRPPLRPPIIVHTDWQHPHDHQASNETIRVHSVKGDSSGLDSQRTSDPAVQDDADLKTPSNGLKKSRVEGTPESHTDQPAHPPSVKSDTLSLSTLPTPSKEARPSTPRRQRAGFEWSRSTSSSIWIHSKKPSMDTEGRRPSNVSNTSTPTPGSGQVALRSDRTASKSKKTRPHNIFNASESSSIKVDTNIAEHRQRAGKTDSSEEIPAEKTPADESSRTSSINPKRLFSAPLLTIRRASEPKVSEDTASTRPMPTLSKPRAVRLTEHPSQLKRNYTEEALQRVTTILENTKSVPPTPGGLLPPSPFIRPSSRPPTPNERKGVHVVQGIVSQFTFYHRKSVEQLPQFDSPTSSQLSLRLGPEPANTPEERATYKVKRSPSAETEEFLKIDISIRGGTSYLASEARRIHTPPIPEAGADGKWRGFFFDYNAPSVDGSALCSPAVSTGSISSVGGGEDGNRSPIFFKDLGRRKSKPCKRVVSGDWYDIKLRQLEAELEPGQMDWNTKNGEKRLNSHKLLGKPSLKRGSEQFDLTIPEHLPSSPLCPRHPRYWRVVKGKGSQFRGC